MLSERGAQMPPQELIVAANMQRTRLALKRAKMITSMLQGTMGLEGQALDQKTLKAMTKQTAKELLAPRR